MPRTKTSHETQVLRGDVTFAFGAASGPHVTTITLAAGSTWSASPHWHETHTEYLRVRTGTARVRLGATVRAVTADDGPVEVPRGTIHDWGRHPAHPDGALVVEEWTEPTDGEKELFFRNLFSTIRDLSASPPAAATPPWGLQYIMPWHVWIELQVMVISAAFDNYPLLVGGGDIGRLVSRICLLLLAGMGKILGLRAVYPEYTPSQAYQGNKKGV